MKRRTWILGSAGVITTSFAKADHSLIEDMGSDFKWGVANAAFQVEGAASEGGRSMTIWDDFTKNSSNIKDGSNAQVASDFYHNYTEDIKLASSLGFKQFRFSISWARLMQPGMKELNTEGVAFYHNLIDAIINEGMQPWVTLYHWDLPSELQKFGGWSNRKIIDYFEIYVEKCVQLFGSKVKKWFIANEPAAFVSLGYLSGYHAPGKKSPFGFLRAVHYVLLSVSAAFRKIKSLQPDAMVGMAYSCSPVEGAELKDFPAAKRIDVLLNRLFVEPHLGSGYPFEDLPALKRLEKYIEPGDMDSIKCAFDFVGIQYYFRVVVKKSRLIPFFGGREIPASKRGVVVNSMGREIYPKGLLDCLKRFHEYGFKDLVVSENGVCFRDELVDGKVKDEKRIAFFQDHLEALRSAKQQGIPVSGYFVWSLTDNFEWSEGFSERFGLIYIDYPSQKRILKDSAKWWQSVLKGG